MMFKEAKSRHYYLKHIFSHINVINHKMLSQKNFYCDITKIKIFVFFWTIFHYDVSKSEKFYPFKVFLNFTYNVKQEESARERALCQLTECF